MTTFFTTMNDVMADRVMHISYGPQTGYVPLELFLLDAKLKQ
jgi:hypothetical protein